MRPILLLSPALLGLALCACGGSDDASGKPRPPAALTLQVPTALEVAPECASPTFQLRVDGEAFSCTTATFTPADGSPAVSLFSCGEEKGLRAATPYALEVEYVQGSRVVARGRLEPSPTTLAEGSNTLKLARDAVRADVDANANGTPDMAEACP